MKSSIWYIHLAGILFLAAGLSINPLRITRAFFSDESVYYTMAYSFAEDGDMEFGREDLIRVYKEFAAGPQGIVLKLNERDQSIVFGKSFLYSLIAAPFVKLFRTNGFFIFHALLLWLNLLCGYRFCKSFMQERKALFFTAFYFLANASLVYLYWMTPEYFSMSLICYAVFFFVAGETFQSKLPLLRAPYNYFVSAIFFGMATFAKPTNALLIVPLGIWMLYRKKILTAMLTLSVYAAITIGLFGANVYFTGEWNYQSGKRAVFYGRFPFERPGASEFAPFKRKRQVQVNLQTYRPPFYVEAFTHNWLYFFLGRFSGLAIYFFPMFFLLLSFLFWKKKSLSLAVYIAGWVGILTYMVGIPWNYFGGSGTIGNRYLFNSFAVFLFSLNQEPSRKSLAAGYALSLFFTAGLLFTPVLTSFDNGFHQKRGAFRMLPVEKTLLSDLPINTNPRARRVLFDQKATYFAYFVNDATYFGETFQGLSGFWVKGERTAQVVIRAFKPAGKVKILATSLAENNVVEVEANGHTTTIPLKKGQVSEKELNLPKPLPYDRDNTGATFLYTLRFHSQTGVIHDQAGYGERYLGTFIRLELPEAEGVEVPGESDESE